MDYIFDKSLSSIAFRCYTQRDMIFLESKRVELVKQFYDKHLMTGLFLERPFFSNPNLKELLFFKRLSKLEIHMTMELVEFKSIYELNDLKELCLANDRTANIALPKDLEIDFSLLPNLEKLSTINLAKFANIYTLANLSEVSIALDDDSIEYPVSLTKITLGVSKRTNLNFLKTQTQLSILEIFEGKITNIDGIVHVKHSLKTLRLYKCSKIENIDVLESLDSLELLVLESFSKEAKLRYAPVLERLVQKGVTVKYYF